MSIKKTIYSGFISLLLIMPGPGYAQDEVSMSFRDAEIRSLVESVSEVTGRTFVLDPRVTGRVTIISTAPIDSDMLYEAFLSALQVQGFQAVEDGAVTRIVPINQAFGMQGGGSNEIVTRLIEVRYVNAASLVPVVKPLLSASARIQAFAESNYLIVSDISSNVDYLLDLIEEMDDPSQNSIEVINLEYISPGEAVHIVSQLNQIREQGLSVVEDTLNNRLIISGPSALRTAFKSMLEVLDVPTTRVGGVEVIYLNYSQAIDLQPIVESLMSSEMFLLSAGEGESESSYKAEVDEANNALIVAAPPGVIRELKNVIVQLDKARPQVLIEAVIAELSADQANRLSSELVYLSQENGGYLTQFDNLLGTLLGISGGIDVPDEVIGEALGQIQGGAIAGGTIDREGNSFGLLIQALQSDTSTRVLSTPSILTLDNREASLSVGAEVPFLTGSYTSSNNDVNNPFQTIDRQDVGIKLTVQPQINDAGSVRLYIEQESSKLIGSGTLVGAVDVVTSKSTITTNVLVEDGELLVLGGLIENQFDESVQRVPFFGSIPLVGGLFRSSSKKDDQSVLMMFIRPTVIRDSEEAEGVSTQQFNYLIRHDLMGEEDGSIQLRLEEIVNPESMQTEAETEE